MKEEKLKDWEYMLKSTIYLALIGYNDSNGYTIPCSVRGEMEDEILKNFKERLAKDNYQEPVKITK